MANVVKRAQAVAASPTSDKGVMKAAAAAGRGAATPQGCTNFKLKQLARVVSRHFDAHVVPSGLRITQYSLLSHVAGLGPLRLGELAATMRLEPSTLTRNLQPLVERGLLVVHTAGDDQRSRVVQITAAGLALRQDVQKSWKRAQLAVNATLGDARVVALHSLIDECLALLGGDTETENTDA